MFIALLRRKELIKRIGVTSTFTLLFIVISRLDGYHSSETVRGFDYHCCVSDITISGLSNEGVVKPPCCSVNNIPADAFDAS